jgi:clan AA aspartic protease
MLSSGAAIVGVPGFPARRLISMRIGAMGIVYTDLRLANHARADLEEINVTALVNTGALHLCIPEHVSVQLQLEPLKAREVQTADGKSHLVDYVAPVRVSLLGRECVTGALVFGNQVLLGAIPMEDMDLIIEPSRQKVSVNPMSPNIPLSLAKAAEAFFAWRRA